MRLIGPFIAAGLLAGCALFGIGTPGACPAALLEGTLAPHPDGGAGVLNELRVQAVQWPSGYTVSSVAGKVQLLDPSSTVVAGEGEMIYVGGGFTPEDTLFIACGYVSNEPP